MSHEASRRALLKAGLATAGLSVLGIPEWAVPVLAQEEASVPFSDLPPDVIFVPTPDRRLTDIRRIDGPFTPTDQFYTTQHYGHPDVDLTTYRLKISGLVNKPVSFSLDDLRRMKSTELVFGFECSGNRRPLQGLASNGKWTGVPLASLLQQAGVQPEAKQVVFFGADKGMEDVDFRGQVIKVEQQFGRSLTREKALSPELLLAYALNGQPLTRHQGSPLRLLVPGWYGVAHVKWLSQIHLQEDEYLGKFQARWYRTLRGETIDGETKWTERAVSHMQLKSFIARVSHTGTQYKVLGVVLNDGTPIKSVEVKVDDGPWQPAALDPATKEKYSWKLFTYAWNNPAAGEHTLVSRVTDITGKVQPTEQELENKKTFLEDNSQFPRKVTIA